MEENENTGWYHGPPFPPWFAFVIEVLKDLVASGCLISNRIEEWIMAHLRCYSFLLVLAAVTIGFIAGYITNDFALNP